MKIFRGCAQEHWFNSLLRLAVPYPSLSKHVISFVIRWLLIFFRTLSSSITVAPNSFYICEANHIFFCLAAILSYIHSNVPPSVVVVSLTPQFRSLIGPLIFHFYGSKSRNNRRISYVGHFGFRVMYMRRLCNPVVLCDCPPHIYYIYIEWVASSLSPMGIFVVLPSPLS